MMDKKEQLKRINTELKIYINESSFISNASRNKLIRSLGNEFGIHLPMENFARIDVSLLEDGSIEMRDEVYKQSENLSFDEVLEKYASFKTKADALLERRGKKAFPNNEKNNIINLFIVVLISFLFIALAIYTMESFLAGDYIDCIWLIIFLFSWLIPSIRERFVQASYYIKRKIKNSNHE